MLLKAPPFVAVPVFVLSQAATVVVSVAFQFSFLSQAATVVVSVAFQNGTGFVCLPRCYKAHYEARL